MYTLVTEKRSVGQAVSSLLATEGMNLSEVTPAPMQGLGQPLFTGRSF